MKRELYPNSWDKITLQVKEAADWKCSKCGKPCRRPEQSWEEFQYHLYKCVSESLAAECLAYPRRFILTTAHYPDPNPVNISSENLHAWCSVCHLKADAQLHASRAGQTKKQRKRHALEAADQLTLFDNLLE
jgi:hypothetical protein